MSEIFIETTAIELWDIDRLAPYEANAKKHPPEQIKAIAASIRRNGWRSNPIEILADGTIVNGHGRRLAALELGLKKVPITVIGKDMTDEQIRAYRIEHNKAAESDWDNDLLQAEMIDLTTFGIDFSDVFSARELEFIKDDLGEINLDAVSTDIAGEVTKQTNRTQKLIDEEAAEEFHLSAVLGFSKVTAVQRLALSRLIAHAQQVTGETGAEALAAFARDYVGLQEAA